MSLLSPVRVTGAVYRFSPDMLPLRPLLLRHVPSRFFGFYGEPCP